MQTRSKDGPLTSFLVNMKDFPALLWALLLLASGLVFIGLKARLQRRELGKVATSRASRQEL